MKLFSIIIPIYNVEQYITKCFNNIYSQGIEDNRFEIIAVNDGTPDNSMKYIEEFQKKHDNIVVINKKNGGVSSARNVGICNAKGEYIIFLDPDDYLADGALSIIEKDIVGYNADIFVLRSIKSVSNTEVYTWTGLFTDRHTDSGTEIYKKGYTRGSVCGCIFNKDFINKYNIRFYEKAKNCEDTIFFFLCQMHAGNVTFVNSEFYMVYERENSASRNISEEKLLLMFNNLEYIKEYGENNNVTDEICLDMLETLRYLLISNLTYYSIMYNGTESLKMLKQNNIGKYLPITIKYGTISKGINKWYNRLMNVSYRLYFYMRSIKNTNR